MSELQPQYTSIADLKPAMRNLNLRFIVLDVSKSMRTKEGQEVCTAKIADKSGAVNLTVWNELCTLLEPSDICRLHNAYTNIWKGALTVQTGKQGELKRIGQFSFAFSEVPDLSAVVYADWEQQPPAATMAGGAQKGSNSTCNTNANSNGNFVGARHERHDSGPQTGPAVAQNHQHGASRPENSHRMLPVLNDASASLPQSSAGQQPLVPGGPRNSTGNSASNTPTTAAAASGSAPSLNAFRQAFIQTASSSNTNVSRANASPTPVSAPNRNSSVSTPPPVNKASSNESSRKHVYREIDMFASAPPEKKVRVGVADSNTSQNAPSQPKLAKLKADAGANAKTSLTQAATKK